MFSKMSLLHVRIILCQNENNCFQGQVSIFSLDKRSIIMSGYFSVQKYLVSVPR